MSAGRTPPRARRPEDPTPARRAGPRRSRWSTAARAAAWTFGAAAVVAVLLVFVFPTRTYLDQRHQMQVVSERLRVLTQQNSQLAAQADKLHSDAEIERLARQQYHLVLPGEKAFAILPAQATATTTPAAPPPARVARSGGLWHTLLSWLP